MLALAMAILFGAYTVGSWGWVLIKGWDIPWIQWVSPLHPWEWTAANAASPPIVPAGQIFPSAPKAKG